MGLIGFGGAAIQPSIIHICNLYPPTLRARVLTLLTGAFQSSFLIFFAFWQLWRFLGVSHRQLFGYGKG
jgi:hypothetical protein